MAMRNFFVKGLLGFLPVTNVDGETGLVVGGNGEAEDGAPGEVGQGVDGSFGVENAMEGV